MNPVTTTIDLSYPLENGYWGVAQMEVVQVPYTGHLGHETLDTILKVTKVPEREREIVLPAILEYVKRSNLKVSDVKFQ